MLFSASMQSMLYSRQRSETEESCVDEGRTFYHSTPHLIFSDVSDIKPAFHRFQVSVAVSGVERKTGWLNGREFYSLIHCIENVTSRLGDRRGEK